MSSRAIEMVDNIVLQGVLSLGGRPDQCSKIVVEYWSVALRKLYFVVIFPVFASYSYLDSMLRPFIIPECFEDRLKWLKVQLFNPLAPNDVYISRTLQLTSRRCILNIYSTNILAEYFKHAAHFPFFFSLQDAVYFIMLSFLVPVICTF